MKYYIIAGEVSGDLHASYLMKEIANVDSDAVFRGFGGDKMQQAGCEITKHINQLAFMGFVEVVKNIGTISKNIKTCKEDILAYAPDAIIMVDYPGFNLRIAKWAKRHNIKVFYYISPTVWAWRKGRMKTLNETTERLYVILPFEKEFYARHNYEVEYYGSPLVEEIVAFRRSRAASDPSKWDYNTVEWRAGEVVSAIEREKQKVLLMPGSRKQEIRAMLPTMLALSDAHPTLRFVIAGVDNIDASFYKDIIAGRDIELVFNDTYNLLSQAQIAIVTSGTATLETALFRVPQVVCYKANVISYFVARLVAKVKYISLVNLILDKQVIVELIQSDFTYQRLAAQFESLLCDDQYRNKIKADYDKIIHLFGQTDASFKIANDIYGRLKQ